MENKTHLHSRRDAMLWFVRLLAALGLTSFGIKIGLQKPPEIPHKNQPQCRDCGFARNTCVPKTPACRKEKS